jgi:hypothetical protein
MEYESLVLSGGGIKGLSQLGALDYFASRGMLKSINRYIGVSVGSIISLLLCLGMSPFEIFSEVYKMEDIIQIKEGTIVECFAKYYSNIIEGYGLLSLASLITKLKEITKYNCLSFTELKEKTKKDLVIGVVNVTERKTEWFGPDSDMDVFRAIEISCSLPFVFVRQKMGEDYMIDGGILDNYPCHKGIGKTLGICVSQYRGDSAGLIGYVYSLVTLSVEAMDKVRRENLALKHKLGEQCPEVDTLDISFTGVNLFVGDNSTEKRKELFIHGNQSAKKWLDKEKRE